MRGNSSAGRHPQAELRPAGGDAGLVLVHLDVDAARRQGADDVGRQATGEHDDAVAPTGHGDLDGDRELEVGAGEREPVAGQLHADAGEHGQGRAAAGRGAACGAEGLDEDIALASELHAVGSLSTVVLEIRKEGVVVGPVDWGQTDILPGQARFGRPTLVPRVPQGE